MSAIDALFSSLAEEEANEEDVLGEEIEVKLRDGLLRWRRLASGWLCWAWRERCSEPRQRRSSAVFEALLSFAVGSEPAGFGAGGSVLPCLHAVCGGFIESS